MSLSKIVNKKILVVKYGSSSVSGLNGLDYSKISKYSEKLHELSRDYRIVVVSSGAVMAGKSIIGVNKSTDASIYSMVGSALLVSAWQQAFVRFNIKVGQILVTHNDIKEKIEGNRLRLVIGDAINKGIIPIINENDVLSDIELAKLTYGGDNDGLASRIAITIEAKELLLLTNVDGLLDENGNIIKCVDSNNHKTALNHTNGKSESGRGGMRSKIEAAVLATKAGINVHIGNSSSDYRMLISGEACTHIQ